MQSIFQKQKLCILVLSISYLVVFSCRRKLEKKPLNIAAQSITILSLGFTDSATEHNKGHGLGRYLYIDLTNDSVIIYRKILSGNSNEPFSKTQISGMIKGLGTNNIIKSFLNKVRDIPNGNLLPEYPEGTLYDGPTFLAVIKTESMNKAFSFSTPELASTLEHEIRQLSKFNQEKFNNTVTLNEDSILTPILSSKAFSFIRPTPPLVFDDKFKAEVKQ